MVSLNDIKLYIFNASAFAVSLSNIDVALKLTLLAVVNWLHHTEMVQFK